MKILPVCNRHNGHLKFLETFGEAHLKMFYQNCAKLNDKIVALLVMHLMH